MLRLALLLLCVVNWLESPAVAQRFIGNPVVDLSGTGDGRRVRLVQPFSFEDADGTSWPVPVGTLVDGASIPQPFWSLIGGPFEGQYRDASIIHDFYCDRKDRPWRKVHRMFYSAMLARGVAPLKAKLMYYSVFQFGPRWELKRTLVPSRGFSGATKMVERDVIVNLPTSAYDAARAETDLKAIEDGDLSLDQIEALGSGPVK